MSDSLEARSGKPKSGEELQYWVDAFLSCNSTERRSEMLANLQTMLADRCISIKSACVRTRDGSEMPALKPRIGSMDVNYYSVHPPLARLVQAGEKEAVRILCQRLDLDLTCTWITHHLFNL